MRYFKAYIGRHSSVLVLRFVVLLVAFALFAAACGDDGDDEEATPAAPAATAPAAAPTTAPVAVPTLAQATAAPVMMRDSVTVVMSGGLSPLDNLDTTINGLRFTVIANVYDPLTRYNAQDTEFEPKLATSWERINDNTIRFSLRPNVKFHSGSAFAADDVKFHIDRIKDPEVGSPANFWYAPVEEVKVVDNLTVDFVGESYGMLKRSQHTDEHRQGDLRGDWTRRVHDPGDRDGAFQGCPVGDRQLHRSGGEPGLLGRRSPVQYPEVPLDQRGGYQSGDALRG